MINKVFLIGRLGRDPEKRVLPESNAAYTRFTLATNESYKDKQGEWKDSTEWHNVVIWGEGANRAEQMLKKGQLVYIEGKLTHRQWTDKEGVNRNMTEVRTLSFRILEKRQSTEPVLAEQEQGEYMQTGTMPVPPILEVEPIDPGVEDDLPF